MFWPLVLLLAMVSATTANCPVQYIESSVNPPPIILNASTLFLSSTTCDANSTTTKQAYIARFLPKYTGNYDFYIGSPFASELELEIARGSCDRLQRACNSVVLNSTLLLANVQYTVYLTSKIGLEMPMGDIQLNISMQMPLNPVSTSASFTLEKTAICLNQPVEANSAVINLNQTTHFDSKCTSAGDTLLPFVTFAASVDSWYGIAVESSEPISWSVWDGCNKHLLTFSCNGMLSTPSQYIQLLSKETVLIAIESTVASQAVVIHFGVCEPTTPNDESEKDIGIILGVTLGCCAFTLCCNPAKPKRDSRRPTVTTLWFMLPTFSLTVALLATIWALIWAPIAANHNLDASTIARLVLACICTFVAIVCVVAIFQLDSRISTAADERWFVGCEVYHNAAWYKSKLASWAKILQCNAILAVAVSLVIIVQWAICPLYCHCSDIMWLQAIYGFISAACMIAFGGLARCVGTNLYEAVQLSIHNCSETMVAKNLPLLGLINPELFYYWVSISSKEFPGIPTTRAFFDEALQELLVFFRCCELERGDAGKSCYLPSKAVDSVWHAWLRLDIIEYAMFCKMHFGKVIAHVESENLPGGPGLALARTYVNWCKLNNVDPCDGIVPSLFQIDARLGMPLGSMFVKVMEDSCDYREYQITCLHTCGRGITSPSTEHSMNCLHPAFFAAEGLIPILPPKFTPMSEEERARFKAMQERREDDRDRRKDNGACCDGGGCSGCGDC